MMLPQLGKSINVHDVPFDAFLTPWTIHLQSFLTQWTIHLQVQESRS